MEFTIKLTELELNEVLTALSKEPYNLVVQLLPNIQRQAQEQVNLKDKPEVVTE